ncbi:hypothetical protein M436DRAFT_68262 [Aureobasidium namibiae CBS 147.97]|uniref:Uncharacterized protein n=1 Tax=Aureobasidium namibiae CBS 147.97 TaxID=1043004 RepID=A0A074W5X6_9PEZI
MTNVVPNSIVAMAASANGSLYPGTILTATGGDGGNLLNSMTGKPGQPDALSSSDSIVVAGDYLFNVNAGSNSVSMFSIDPWNPMEPTLLGCKSSMGDFPVPVAVSLKHKMVCVANTGINAGVSCASFDSTCGMGDFDELRRLNVGQTQNPPTGSIPGVGDIIFNGDESEVIVFVKGNGKDMPGFVEKYAVLPNGSLSQQGEQFMPPGLAVEFGSAVIPRSNNLVLSSQANFGAVVLDLNDLTAQPMATTNITGQGATCWAEISTYTGTGFVTDPTINRLVETNLTSGKIVSEYYPPNYNAGMTDFRISDNKIWFFRLAMGPLQPVSARSILAEVLRAQNRFKTSPSQARLRMLKAWQCTRSGGCDGLWKNGHKFGAACFVVEFL